MKAILRYRRLLLTALIFIILPLAAQQVPHGLPAIQSALNEGRLEAAAKMVDHDFNQWLSEGKADSLIDYIPVSASIVKKLTNNDAAAKDVEKRLATLVRAGLSGRSSVEAHRGAAHAFESIYKMPAAYAAMQQALTSAAQLPEKREHYLAKCEYDLGVFSYKMGDIAKSQEHYRRAVAFWAKDRDASDEDFYLAYNSMAVGFWHSARYDSAETYFAKALETVQKLPQDNINRYFRPALLKNNLVGVYRENGQTTKALQTAEECISDFKHFIDGKGGDSKKQYAGESWCAAIENLAGIYQDVDDYKKAEHLLQYAYRQKTQRFPGSYDIAISEILLGQYYNKTRNFDKAEKLLESALRRLKDDDGNYTFWQGDAYYTLALIYARTNRSDDAASAYDKSEALYEQAYAGSYDNVYMEFLNNKALFFAENHRYDAAMAAAAKTGNYLKEIGATTGTQGFMHLLNLAEIQYATQHFAGAIDYSNKALAHLHQQFSSGNSLLDSIRAESFTPKIILIRAKASYALQQQRDTAFLAGIYHQLDTALQLLERRKSFIEDPESINLMIGGAQELIDFNAQIALELFRKTSSIIYLEKFINTREAALYSRIRSRLNKEKAIRFSRVPEEVIATENTLKEKIQLSLASTGNDQQEFERYLSAMKAWEKQLLFERDQYPAYYRLRHATLFYDLPALQHLIPEGTTLVRYYQVDTALVALVADRTGQQLIDLTGNGLAEMINELFEPGIGEQEQLAVLHRIYRQVWAPLSSHIRNKKVMVIPDGLLYNINMEMLPVQPVHRYSELAVNALLSKHIFSYHYSVFMLEEPAESHTGYKNYVVFAPGFSDELKDAYVKNVSDSLKLDEKFLKLLPQPANNRLARKLQQSMGGDVYLDGNSTSSAFRSNAGDHAIIHLATHGEFNNAIPEQSGLFFAKSADGKDDNFFTLNEIYRSSMNADLMILTACESGKPGFQDGEGLVSLAHAFNYAGSRNILTALWKVDEEASAAITESFAAYVQQGFATDEALTNAKLAYLRQHEGRVLDPAYWSGLVLMGKPLTLKLHKQVNYFPWITGTCLLGVIIATLLLILKKRGRIR